MGQDGSKERKQSEAQAREKRHSGEFQYGPQQNRQVYQDQTSTSTYSTAHTRPVVNPSTRTQKPEVVKPQVPLYKPEWNPQSCSQPAVSFKSKSSAVYSPDPPPYSMIDPIPKMKNHPECSMSYTANQRASLQAVTQTKVPKKVMTDGHNVTQGQYYFESWAQNQKSTQIQEITQKERNVPRISSEPEVKLPGRYQPAHLASQPTSIPPPVPFPRTVIPSKNPEIHQNSQLQSDFDKIHNPATKLAINPPLETSISTSRTFYNSSYNPKKSSLKTFIDLDLEIPKIIQAAKSSKNQKFKKFDTELNKSKSLSDIRKGLINSDYLSDVKFIINGQVIHAHKAFLVTSSFLFYEHFQGKGETEMRLEDIDLEIFMKILNYCYTDKMQVTEDDVWELLKAGNRLQVRQISNICNGFISKLMNPNLIFGVFEKALEAKNENFQKKCIDFINKNEENCFKSKGFHQVSLPSLMKILEVCNYPHGKVNEIIEKYMSGSMKPVDTDSENDTQSQPETLDNNPNAKPTGAVKKPKKKQPPGQQNYRKNQQNQKMQIQNKPEIPDLMSLPIPDLSEFHPFIQSQSMAHHVFMQQAQSAFRQSQENFNSNPIINFDDEASSIISKDDENTRIYVHGPRNQGVTEISRIDLVCKRSMLIREIGFSGDLAKNCTEIRLKIAVFEQNKWTDIHNRVLSNANKPGMRLNFIRFSREPLKVYVGQKLFIKLNFSEPLQRCNILPEKLSATEILQLHKDDTKKYFNCISSLLVSEMPTA